MNDSMIATNGCFDIIHPDHVNLFYQMSKYKPVVMVFLNSDESFKRYKGRPPIMCQEHRKEVIEAIQWVTYVEIFEEKSPRFIIEEYKPAIYVKGEDWDMSKTQTAFRVKEYGGRVFTIPMKYDIHVTEIMERIKQL